jgi:outer membrane protein TolC
MNRLSGSFIRVTLAAGVAIFVSSVAEGFAQSAEPGAITLQQAVQMAVQKAPEVAIVQVQEARSLQALRETKASNLPQLVAGTGLAYNNGFPLSIEGAAPSIVHVAVTQSIFSKKNKNLILEAEQGAKTSRLAAESVRNDLAVKAALAYFMLHQARKLASLWGLRRQALEKEELVIAALLESGKVKPVELTLAQTATQSAAQQVLVAEEQARIAAFELREMTGLPEGTEIRTLEPVLDERSLSESAENLYLMALKTHPEILQAESEIRTKEFGVEAAKGEALPRMDLVGQYALFAKTNNYADYFNRFDRNNYLVGLSVQMPLFDGSRNRALLAQSRHEVSEAKYRLQKAKSNLKLEIERSMSSFRIAKGASQLAQRELSASQESLLVNETLYEAGRISLKDVETARAQMREKQLAQFDTESELFQRKIELMQLTSDVSRLLGE